MVICNEENLRDDGCHGAPDLVIEIVSDSTRSRDYGAKLRVYREAGVREYWIIDTLKENVFVSFFEEEILSSPYSFDEEISFCLFTELCLRPSDWTE